MNFSVTILGSGSAIPTSRRNPSAQYVQCSNRHFLIDCGEGTQMQIRKLGIKFQRINHIFISHLHGDHYFGLVGLLSTMHLMGRVKPIHIFGPKGLRNIIETQLQAGGASLAYEVLIEEVEPHSSGVLFEDDKVRVNYFPLKHRIPTSGFLIIEKPKERKLLADLAKRDGVKIEHYHKLKAGLDVEEDGKCFSSEKYTLPGEPEKRYAYCSDTAYFESVIEHIKDIDLLYHEATFIELMRDRAIATNHSTAKDAATIASKANVRKLLLGHLSARYDSGEEHLEEATAIFENSEVVDDGKVYLVD